MNIPVRLDWNLLRQSVSNLLDNAGKYSKRDTSVVIETGLSWKGLEINVENMGIPIAPSEVELVKQRDWRSPRAVSVTGEGSGIGLWIVDQVMQAHKGTLSVAPTNYNGVTAVTLHFPRS